MKQFILVVALCIAGYTQAQHQHSPYSGSQHQHNSGQYYQQTHSGSQHQHNSGQYYQQTHSGSQHQHNSTHHYNQHAYQQAPPRPHYRPSPRYSCRGRRW